MKPFFSAPEKTGIALYPFYNRLYDARWIVWCSSLRIIIFHSYGLAGVVREKVPGCFTFKRGGASCWTTTVRRAACAEPGRRCAGTHLGLREKFKETVSVMPTRFHLVPLCCFFDDLKPLEPALRSVDFLFRYACLGSFGAHFVFTPIHL